MWHASLTKGVGMRVARCIKIPLRAATPIEDAFPGLPTLLEQRRSTVTGKPIRAVQVHNYKLFEQTRLPAYYVASLGRI
jgi:hypothetical protein